MNKEDLLKVHQRNGNNGDWTEELVDILGGIDTIIDLILSSNIDLEDDKILQINKILTQKYKHIVIQQPKNKKSNDPTEFTYYFNRHNTFLHSLFGQAHGENIINVLSSKYMICIMVIMIITFWALVLYELSINSYVWYICGILLCVICLFYTISAVLSVNKKSFYLMTRKFIFWFKLYNIITLCFWWAINRYVIKQNEKKKSIVADITLFTLSAILISLFVILVSLVDGCYIKLWRKIIIASSGALGLSLLSINFSFYSYINGVDNSLIEVPWIGITISCISMIGSSSSVIAIFFWKNVINAIRKRGKCVLIQLPSPYIEWIDNTMDDENDAELDHLYTG